MSPNVDIDAHAESPDAGAMLLAELEDFVTRHRPYGPLTGDATEPEVFDYYCSENDMSGCVLLMRQVRESRGSLGPPAVESRDG